MTLLFIILAMLTIAGAVAAVTLRSAVHCALALMIAFAGLAALYIELGAQFVGLSQVLVYVGAVAILIVFAILLTRGAEIASQGMPPSARRGAPAAGILVAAAVFAVLAWTVVAGKTALPTAPPQAAMKQIGDALMQRFVLPLEVIGLMLTAALIGAVVLAMQDKRRAQ